jgi:hypothetical protein
VEYISTLGITFFLQAYRILIVIDVNVADESDLPAATEGTPVPGEDASPFVFLEEADEQAVEIPLSLKKEKLGVTNQESARPSREKKSRGRERIQNILQQTDDSINYPLFSSDSDVYEPSSSSSDDEACLSKKTNVLIKYVKNKRLLVVSLRETPQVWLTGQVTLITITEVLQQLVCFMRIFLLQ